jgi:hypothetical protein
MHIMHPVKVINVTVLSFSVMIKRLQETIVLLHVKVIQSTP